MATTPTLLSIEEYLRTSYKPDVDFVDGEIEERNMGEFQHARIQNLIAFFLTLNEKSWSTQTIVEQRIRVAARRVRICDVAVLRADAPREQVTTTPPLICIEILSPARRGCWPTTWRWASPTYGWSTPPTAGLLPSM